MTIITIAPAEPPIIINILFLSSSSLFGKCTFTLTLFNLVKPYKSIAI
jgi:hypothetical protein